MTGETKPVGVNTLKKGSNVVFDGIPCKVTDIQTSRPGKHGHAKCRISVVGLLDENKKIIKVMPGHDSVDSPVIEKRNAQILNVVGEMANIMDAETYETFDLPIPEELKGKIKAGDTVLYWVVLDSKVIRQVQNSE